MLADRIGNMNVNIICSMVSGIATLTLWCFAYNFQLLIIYAIMIGLFGGTFYALCKFTTLNLFFSFIETEKEKERGIV